MSPRHGLGRELEMNPSTATMWCRLRLYFVPFLITATRRHATVYPDFGHIVDVEVR